MKVRMAARNDTLKDRLSRFREIKLSVTGRNSGRTISIPVWFVLEGDKLYLLPVQGSGTQWHKNVLKNPSIRIEARVQKRNFRPFLSRMPKRSQPWRPDGIPESKPKLLSWRSSLIGLPGVLYGADCWHSIRQYGFRGDNRSTSARVRATV
jgi:hypothetical protein